MRVLCYNWVDNLDEAGRGGGVRQYQRNLMRAFTERPGIDAVFLSSGLAHDLRGGAPRWAPVRHGPKEGRERRFELINARPLAPSHHSFGTPEQLSHPPTEAAFAAFLDAVGPFDVIHFNNLEGLPAAVLGERARRPGTRFVLSLHNYYPFCPQVNLWRQEREHCADFDGGRACVDCLPFRRDPRSVRAANALNSTLDRAGLRPGSALREGVVTPAIRGAGRLARHAAGLRRRPAPAAAEASPDRADAAGAAFAHRREEMVRLIGAQCDVIHCVSERVRDIARGFGLPEARLAVAYIGSDHADRFARTRPRDSLVRPDGTMRLAFLGYMRRDKGGYFLLDALERLPGAVASRLHLLIAAAGTPPDARTRIEALRPRVASLAFRDGYDRDGMDTLLADVDLGVVPVLWEDALPQVAIELHARHIPLLTSDRGGARELGRCDALVFPAGDAGAFADRIAAALAGEIDLAAYWAGAMAPVTLDAHVDRLRSLYAGIP